MENEGYTERTIQSFGNSFPTFVSDKHFMHVLVLSRDFALLSFTNLVRKVHYRKTHTRTQAGKQTDTHTSKSLNSGSQVENV